MVDQTPTSELPYDALLVWAAIGRRGTCVHSFFSPRRGQPCAGCMLRESQRALGMLLDALEHGVTSPSHGLEINDRQDAIHKARALYAMVEEALEEARNA